MTLTTQILFGSAVLVFCALVHVALVAWCTPYLAVMAHKLRNASLHTRNMGLLAGGLVIILASHTVAIWIWAALFHLTGVFENFPASFYFTTVTYTTLGYGDLVLGAALRVFATFAAITGLLTFGISTAFLIGLLGRILPEIFRESR